MDNFVKPSHSSNDSVQNIFKKVDIGNIKGGISFSETSFRSKSEFFLKTFRIHNNAILFVEYLDPSIDGETAVFALYLRRIFQSPKEIGKSFA